METAGLQLAVWTEGLDENWIAFGGLTERLERGRMEVGEVVTAIERINAENADAASYLFILRHRGRELKLAVARGRVAVSDPNRANYQEVAVRLADLADFLGQYFGSADTTPHFPEEVRSSHVRLLEGMIALVAVAALAATVFLVMRHMRAETGFMPKPVVMEIENPADARDLVNQYAGLYATRIEDGGMLVELDKDGSWALYDVSGSKAGAFRLKMVRDGAWRPVIEDNRTVILTDARFLFYPAGPQQLEFLQRRFSRVGGTREDLPFVAFP